MKIRVTEDHPGELRKKLPQAVEALHQRAHGQGCGCDLHKAKKTDADKKPTVPLIPAMRERLEAAQPTMERVRANMEARIMDVLKRAEEAV